MSQKLTNLDNLLREVSLLPKGILSHVLTNAGMIDNDLTDLREAELLDKSDLPSLYMVQHDTKYGLSTYLTFDEKIHDKQIKQILEDEGKEHDCKYESVEQYNNDNFDNSIDLDNVEIDVDDEE